MHMQKVMSSHGLVSTSNEHIRTLTFQPTIPLHSDKPEIIAVVGNGAFGGPRTFGEIVRRFVEAGTKQGVHVTAVLHHDPWLGRGKYAEDYRTERLAQVFNHTVATNGRAHLVGHSWSWPGVLEISKDTPSSVMALEGYTPTAHQEVKADGTKWRDLMANAVQEARHLNIVSGIGSITSGLMIARDMAVRFPTPTGRSETISAFESQATEKVLHLSGQVPIGILYPEYDAFFHPSERALAQLSEAEVVVRSMPTTHLGAVIDYRHGADLYELTAQLQGID